MAELIFAEAGAQIGGALLPEGLSFLGQNISGAVPGRTIGAFAGRAVDQTLAGPVGEGPRLAGLTLMESREGVGVPRVHGRMRIGGQVIWATRLKEKKRNRSVGGKGGPTLTEYSYTVSFAVGLCAGEITGIDRIWANGEPLSLGGLNWRLYRGGEAQLADPLIEAVEGTVPAFRGLAYAVFEDFPLDEYGARLPQLSFEVVRPVPDRSGFSLRDKVRSVNLIPASGEWVYSPELIRRIEYPGWEETLNRNSGSGEVDVVRALDQLQAELPHSVSVNLTLAWFGTDLRCGMCEVRPGVETRDQINLPRDWHAGGTSRASAHLISRDAEGRPYYGGTPDDASVLALLEEMRVRGLIVTLSPFLLMDVPPGNGLPDLYGGAEQAAFPWRGRMGSANDGTASVRAELAAFFGMAQASDFALNGRAISYSGPPEWSYRRFVLHLAMLAKAAGHVDRFLIGSELVGLTHLRDEKGVFPAVQALRALAGEVRSVLGRDVEISYAADWTEYGAYVPDDGSGDVRFPLDALWADASIDFVGIDWYAPLSDWRDGMHTDGALWPDLHDPDYLASNIEGGEGFHWYYASDADRLNQTRTPISDAAYGEDWVFRVKDLKAWWSQPHHERPGGFRQGAPTAWAPQSKPVRLIEIGCGAVDKGSNAPNVFYDPKSSESRLPHFSDGSRDDAIQAGAVCALCDYWSVGGAHNPVSSVYAGPMIPADGLSVWAFDARPYPAFPMKTDIWSDGENWSRGHWLNGRITNSALGDLITEACAEAGVSVDVSDVTGQLPGYLVNGVVTLRELIEPLEAAFGLTCRQSEAGLVFSNRDHAATIPVPLTDFAPERDGVSAHRHRREVTEHGLKGVRLTVVDPNADYQTQSVRKGERPEGDRDLHIQLPLALDSNAAARLSEALYLRLNAEPLSQRLVVSPERVDIDVGDLILVEGEPSPLKVMSLERAGAITLDLASPVEAFAGDNTPAGGGEVLAHSPRPDVMLLDLPCLPGSEDDTRPLVAAFAHPWPGAVTILAGGAATRLTPRCVVARPAETGRLTSALPAGPGDRWRPGLTVRMMFPTAEPASRERTDVLNGAGLIAIETSAGWMVAGYQAACMVSSDVYALSGLLTGLFGTEDLSCLGAGAGARVVMLDEALVRADLADHEFNESLLWHAKGPGALAEASQFQAAVSGRARKPLRPGHFKAERQISGDIDLKWTRRARHSADRWDAPDVPLLEDRLLFRVKVLNGGDVVRTAETDQSGWVYTSAMQSVDGVSLAGLVFKIAQVSPGFGDGVVAECGA